MHLISRLRDDADLRYICKEPPTGKRGRPRKYSGKINIIDIDKDYFTLISQDEESTVYAAVVYSKALRRNVKLVHVTYPKANGKDSCKLYFSTDVSENKLHFQFNASLTSINIAKVVHWLNLPREERKAFSMSDIKTMNHNTLLLARFIDVFGICPDSIKNQSFSKNSYYTALLPLKSLTNY